MKNNIYILGMLCGLFFSCQQSGSELELMIEKGLTTAKQHALNMAKDLEQSPESLPKTYISDEFITSDAHWWCSGFFPGVLWYLYENDQDTHILRYAEMYSDRVESQKYITDNHDIGFILNCSFGNAYRIQPDDRYKDVLITGANSLATRFNPHVGAIRSWDHKADMWQYPVIIDNMMNLELMIRAAEFTNNDMYRKVAISHADVTMKHHFRANSSSYHVVSYDTITGRPHLKQTWQGFGDESAWSRGQAWALYGYTMMYRETGEEHYLSHACKVAEFIANHPNLPEDKIPYWDFDDVKIPYTYRDASAAAIMAAAFIELSGYVEEKQAKDYWNIAVTQLKTLTSSEYLAEPGTNGNFILKHSVGALPRNSEVDVPLTYADYYYVEALIRLKKKLSS